jgi:hypothetical protein
MPVEETRPKRWPVYLVVTSMLRKRRRKMKRLNTWKLKWIKVRNLRASL